MIKHFQHSLSPRPSHTSNDQDVRGSYLQIDALLIHNLIQTLKISHMQNILFE